MSRCPCCHTELTARPLKSVIGEPAFALAPLLSWRKSWRTDIYGSLVVECSAWSEARDELIHRFPGKYFRVLKQRERWRPSFYQTHKIRDDVGFIYVFDEHMVEVAHYISEIMHTLHIFANPRDWGESTLMGELQAYDEIKPVPA